MFGWGQPLGRIAVVFAVFSALSMGLADDSEKSSKPAAKGKSEADPAKAVPPGAKSKLEAAGLRVTSSGLSLTEETEFAKQLRDAGKQKKALITVERELQSAQAELEEIKSNIAEGKAKQLEINTQLAAATDTITNNRLVGAFNVLVGQVNLLIERQAKATDNVKAARAKASEAREAFVGYILNLRTSADKVTQQWETLAADATLQAAVKEASDATGKKFVLKPSQSFVTAERALQGLEEKVLSETIPLTKEGGGLMVNVVINGKHTRQMTVDSGATLISLPNKMAKEMGIEPSPRDQKIIVGLADGSKVPATLISIQSVRVGKFTVEDVECCVLGAEAVDAPPLLGLSFLGKFKFEVNTDQGELKMVKVETGDPATKPKAAPKSKKKKSS